jgi:hypothetical protein
MLIDTLSNTKIVYIFANKFTWTNNTEKETNVGHPKPGRLYRAIKNTDTNTYRIVYNIENNIQGILIDKLESKDESFGYVADMKEVSLSNVLNFEITEEDLKQFDNWLSTNNQDLKDWMNKFFEGQSNKVVIKSKVSVSDKVLEAVRSRDPELASIISMITDLRNIDPILYGALGSFVSYIIRKDYPESSVNDQWVRVDKNLGAGANISSALTKLSTYGGKDRRTNFASADLLDAIKDLLTEQYRRDLHDLK